jgi:small subunit ribosomal protein S8
MQTDPIADYLTRLRNAGRAKHPKVDIPASRMKVDITKILQHHGYIQDYLVIEDNKQNTIRIYLKYDEYDRPVIRGLRRVSKPGLRQYSGVKSLPRVYNNYGLAVLSTPRGIVTDRDARKFSVGGEVLFYVW